jgi:MoaA/NifB/PqqE/SkfB family radical SAM enzyme
MRLSGLHLLLTYQCNLECDHCFVWGSPRQSGTMTLGVIRQILEQAQALGTVEWIYFEGGEPFLYYPVLLKGVQMTVGMGFQAGIVSNGYWATDLDDALEWLTPFAGAIQDLSISSDQYHGDEEVSRQAKNACDAARRLGMPIGVISVAQPEETNAAMAHGQLPQGESAVMYRGRAAEDLAARSVQHPWSQFTECPCEDLREPGRVHLDPLGNVHICQGIVAGNIFSTPLGRICDRYQPDAHPVAGPLLDGGPAELVRRYQLPHSERYADACHLCYEARRTLRGRLPDTLAPDQMYGRMYDEP